MSIFALKISDLLFQNEFYVKYCANRVLRQVVRHFVRQAFEKSKIPANILKDAFFRSVDACKTMKIIPAGPGIAFWIPTGRYWGSGQVLPGAVIHFFATDFTD
jgi:hypothetical protein